MTEPAWVRLERSWKPGGDGRYINSLRDARRFTENRAREIETHANRFLIEGELHEVAKPDPLKH